ncbi:MAG: TetR/AcrR family transcriptional regulator [Shimia sp.]
MNTQERRAALRERLIEIAEARIAEGGLSALKARDLAKEAECAVGAIYNVAGGMHEIALAVNGRTFHRLQAHVAERVGDGPPVDKLIALSHAYLSFAQENRLLWRALFDIELTEADDVPDWYMQELGALFALISGPMAEVFPDYGAEEVQMMTRTLFSSVHGIVLLGLERRISGVPTARLQQMIELLLRNVAS